MVRARHANGGAVPKESRLENEGIARGTIYVGIRICTKYSFFVKPTVSPYRPESFDGIVKNKLPGKLFFFSIHQTVTYVCALYTGASQYIANRSDSSWFFVGF